jgi:hypothetical protein
VSWFGAFRDARGDAPEIGQSGNSNNGLHPCPLSLIMMQDSTDMI